MAEPHSDTDPMTGQMAQTGQISPQPHAKRQPPKRRCKARNRQGNQCGQAPAIGQEVCRLHGGASPQALNAARRRLEAAAERMAKNLLNLADNDQGNTPSYVQLQAINSALDRAGISGPQEVNVTVKPYEQVYDGLVGGSLADYRRSVGDDRPVPIPERPDPLPVLDVDVIESEPDSIAGESSPAGDDEHQAAGLEPATESLGNAPLALPGGKPGYLDTETALSQARAANAKRHETRRR